MVSKQINVRRSVLLCLTAVFLMLPGLALGALQSFKLEKTTVKVEVPEGWQTAQDLFGSPLTVLGPFEEDRRPVFSVVAVEEFSPKFQMDPKKEEVSYRKGREEWLSKFNGAARYISTIPYKKISNPSIKDGFGIGYRYMLEETMYVENTYYVVCKNHTYNLKTLMTSDQEAASAKTFEKMIASFSCE